jgi:hypothetical protein
MLTQGCAPLPLQPSDEDVLPGTLAWAIFLFSLTGDKRR